MKALRNVASVVVLSGAAALFGAGCLGQGDDRADDETTEQAAIGAAAEALTASANPDDAAIGNDERTGESRDHQFWTGAWTPWWGGVWSPWFNPWLRPFWGGFTPFWGTWNPWWGGVWF